MLRRIMSTEKMAILVLPYVSICVEKVFFSFFSQKKKIAAIILHFNSKLACFITSP